LLADYLYTTVVDETDSVIHVHGIFQTVLRSMTKPVCRALERRELLRLPYAQTLLATVFDTVRQCLTVAQTLQVYVPKENFQEADQVVGLVHFFDQSAAGLHQYLANGDTFSLMVDCPSDNDFRELMVWSKATLDFSRKQAHEKFKYDWYDADGRYFVKRGTTSVEVIVPLGDDEDVRESLLNSLMKFRSSYGTVFGGNRFHEVSGQEGDARFEVLV
jgi:hypothetical protein